MPGAEPARSPRIHALWDEYSRRGDAAVETFWDEIEVSGAPLIEAIPGDPDHSIVTFVWQLETRDQRVGLVHGPLRVGELDELDHLGSNDLAFRSYRVANDLQNAYWFVPDPPRSLEARSAEEWDGLQRRRAGERFLVPDPLNHHVKPHFADPLDQASKEAGHSVLTMPSAPRPGVGNPDAKPEGVLTAHPFQSKLLEPSRTVWVYTPQGYAGLADPCDVLVAFDGHRALDEMGMPAILDQLIASGELRPTIAVFVESLFHDRHLELPCHDPFADFLALELMPWLASEYRVTDDPARTTLAGASFGGLAGSFGALRYPERFGNVLSQSASYWWEPADREDRYIAPSERSGDWLTAKFEASPRLPVRFSLDVGSLEGGASTDLLRSVRRFRDVLIERGYDVRYDEFNGGHAWACWRARFPDALVSLVGTATSPR